MVHHEFCIAAAAEGETVLELRTFSFPLSILPSIFPARFDFLYAHNSGKEKQKQLRSKQTSSF